MDCLVGSINSLNYTKRRLDWIHPPLSGLHQFGMDNYLSDFICDIDESLEVILWKEKTYSCRV